jgi:hypothetical protein
VENRLVGDLSASGRTAQSLVITSISSGLPATEGEDRKGVNKPFEGPGNLDCQLPLEDVDHTIGCKMAN